MTNQVQIIQGENLAALRGLVPTHQFQVELVYFDSPFLTGKTQEGKAGSFADPKEKIDDFVSNIAQRAKLAWPLLRPSGCLVVHLDSKSVHYVKVALDRVLGISHFASEIVWRYRRFPSKTSNFQRVHDTLLRYVRDPKLATWNQLYEPLAPSTVATWGGRKQRAVFTGGPGSKLLTRTKSSKTEEQSPGVPMGDVWDIGIIAPTSKERTGYPTQKPEALLERLILATTNPGDLVLEPYMGSGTACAVAQRLGRRAIGIDENPQAVAVARKRLGMDQ